MEIFPISPEVTLYLKKRRLEKKFWKQVELFKDNPFHPSLNTELMEPRRMHLWSFRVDKKYRANFLFLNPNTIEVTEVNNHYR